MADFIADVFSFLENADVSPRIFWAVVVGLLVSWVGTQRVKKSAGRGGLYAVKWAFALGFLPTYTIAPGWGWEPLWVAVFVGLGAPFLYKLLVTFAEHRWEWVRNLSGDRGA